MTAESQDKIRATFLNLNMYYILDTSEVIKNLGLDLTKPSNVYFISEYIEKTIEQYSKSKRLWGIIYINPNLNPQLVSALNAMLRRIADRCEGCRIDGTVLMDRQYFPKLKDMWKLFEEVMFFPEIRRVKMIECRSFLPESFFKNENENDGSDGETEDS